MYCYGFKRTILQPISIKFVILLLFLLFSYVATCKYEIDFPQFFYHFMYFDGVTATNIVQSILIKYIILLISSVFVL